MKMWAVMSDCCCLSFWKCMQMIRQPLQEDWAACAPLKVENELFLSILQQTVCL